MARLLVNLGGIALIVPGVWYLLRLEEIYKLFKTYPAGEHLYPGAMFLTSAIIMIAGNILCSMHKNRQKKLYLLVRSPMIRAINK